ncbi:single-stranded-DNA-specific exonuclease RecJ [Puia dinghuensis]|uniref:Single-stranded-DNA-specific exonuclease RecJ n=1 Tax=Puia dinghuensis TaxID=1792502 RepID=A0A8J2XWD0_9BACT|nr:single-stranded-DNA-specific exonuclease RecJ [Puia dinghuensis]GGB22788.1 single-stranded-DNA-specific exonuclease RecJ [Puia dinghuensis]
MDKLWNILPADTREVRALQASLGINEFLCRILVQRGVQTFDQARSFFRPQLADLHDPWLMKDMDKAVERILLARQRQEKILVYGDYDVDGTTAVACVFQFLRKCCPPEKIDFYIPHRYREGYGISRLGIDHAHAGGFTLVISLDCGIKSADLIAYAGSLGIDFIVCDHHLPDAELPQAAAILNPKQQGCPYPYKELCGCGVGFKLITALAESLGFGAEEALQYLDLVAIAIAADIVSVDGENRVLSYYGLKKVNENPNSGIRALIQLSELRKELKMVNLVFMIAPRVNAAGRMDDARKVVHLFTAPSLEEALSYASQLHADNTDRKEADSNTTEEALAILEKDAGHTGRRSTVLYQPHWHKGVVGIVASRLIERYYRPTIILTRSGEVIAGSARSVNGFNVYEAIHACREHLLGYGGHFAAAGITLLPEKVEDFARSFEMTVAATIQPQSLRPELIIDTELPFDAIRPGFYKILEQMQPFGPGNTQPVFVARRLMDKGSRIVKEHHIRFSLQQGSLQADGIGFGLAAKFALLQAGTPVDVVFTLEENEWNNIKTLQLKVIDLAPSQDGPEVRRPEAHH